MNRALWLGSVTLLTVLVLGLARTAFRVYRHESATFHPLRGEVPRPAAVAGLPDLRDVSFTTGGGTTLRGWSAPSRNGAAVVLLHGSGADRRQVAPQAAALARRGYGVLLFDWPGHGESGGDVSFGEPEREALRAALDLLSKSDGVPPRLGAYGFSLGALALAQAAPFEPRLAAVALEGAPTDLREQTAAEYGNPVARWAALLAIRRAGVDLDGPRPLGLIAQVAPRSLLLIAGAEDRVVPPWMAERLYAAAGQPKELWIVPGATHGDSHERAPREYEERLASFFDRALRPRQ